MRFLLFLLIPGLIYGQSIRSVVFPALFVEVVDGQVVLRSDGSSDIMSESESLPGSQSSYFVVNEYFEEGVYQKYFVQDLELLEEVGGDAVDQVPSVAGFNSAFGAEIQGEYLFVTDFRKASLDTVYSYDVYSGNIIDTNVRYVKAVNASRVFRNGKELQAGFSMASSIDNKSYWTLSFDEVNGIEYKDWQVTYFNRNKSEVYSLSDLKSQPEVLLALSGILEVVDIDQVSTNPDDNFLEEIVFGDRFIWIRMKKSDWELVRCGLWGNQKLYSGEKGLFIPGQYSYNVPWYIVNDNGIYFSDPYFDNGYQGPYRNMEWDDNQNLFVEEDIEDYVEWTESLRQIDEYVVFNSRIIDVQFDEYTGDLTEEYKHQGFLFDWSSGDLLYSADYIELFHNLLIEERDGMIHIRNLESGDIIESVNQAVVDNGTLIVTTNGGDKGTILADGQWGIAPQSGDIHKVGEYFQLHSDCMTTGEPCWFDIVDSTGKILVERAKVEEEQWEKMVGANFYLFKRNQLLGLAQANGEVVWPAEIEEIWDVYEMGEIFRFRVGERWGLVNFQGIIVEEPVHNEQEIYKLADDYIQIVSKI